jgi:hypothetical protein
MAEHNLTFDQQQDVESHAPYLTVFFILLNFTLMEYIYAYNHQHHAALFIKLIAASLAITLLTWAMKLFVHLPFNRNWVYLTLIPAVGLAFLGAALPLVLGLMILAVTKAALVGIYFMHLKYEGRWVFLMLIPAAILATVFIVALYPDVGLQPGVEQEIVAEQAEQGAPPTEAPGPRP